MIVFWTLTGLAVALAGVMVLTAARRATGADEQAAPTATAELAELDRLRMRGLLDDDSWAAARAEAGRRLLAEPAPPMPLVIGRRDRTIALGALVATAAGSLGLYFVVGEPGLPDRPYERRIDEWAASAETLDAPRIAAVLSRAVKREPENLTALTMLGAARFEAGDPIGAATAFRRALTIQPDDATSWARLGESLVRAAEGEVQPDAEAAFARALELDPGQLGARFFLGDAALSRGERERARFLWGPLIAVLDPADPRRADLVARLDAAA
jgi:cytochrome c-type biogenesis protein CcmH